MANYRKSFNFRSGVQVDNDKFLVDQRGNVGVGTSAPNRVLDVYGTARVNGNTETETLNVTGLSTFSSLVSIGTSAFLDPNSGIITAVSYRGDGSLLANVVAIATNGWVVANGGLSTTFNAYIGPFDDPVYYPTPLGRLHVGTGSSIFIVKDTGRVGLGTSEPTGRLDVRGNTSITGILTVTDKIQGNTLVVSSDTSIGGNLDVDGNTELDDLNVSNSTTLNTLNVSGISTLGFATATRVVSKNLEVSGITTILGQVRMQENQSLYFGISGDDPTGLVVRHTDSLGAEIVNVSNQGGDDRKITIQSLREGDIVLSGQYADRAVFTNNGATITGLTSTNDLVVSGFSTLTDAEVTGTLTAPTIVGNLTGIASEASVLSNAANITTGTISDARLPSLITSNISVQSGISTVDKLNAKNIGIGTNVINSDLVIKKSTTVAAELVSTEGSVQLSLSRDGLNSSNSSSLVYNPESESLDLINYGSGDVTFHVHKGAGYLVGPNTGGFFFKRSAAEETLFNIAHDGRVSVNGEVPEAEDLDYKLIVNGNQKIIGSLNVLDGLDISTGIITTQDLVVVGQAQFTESQNFNTTSGLSTFYNLTTSEGGLLTVAGVSSFIGVSTFLNVVDFGTPSEGGLQGGGDSPINLYKSALIHEVDKIGIATSKIYYDYMGGNYQTGFEDPRDQTRLAEYLADPTKIIPAFGYGDIQIRTGGLNIISQDYITIHPSVATSTTGNWTGMSPTENLGMGIEFANSTNLCMIGINTTFTRSIFDIGYGVTSMNSYFVPPRVSTEGVYYVSQLWNPDVAGQEGWFGHTRSFQSSPDGLITGGILFDVDRNQLKVATGSTTFCGIATFTNNHSGYESFVPPKVTNTQRTTLTNAGIPAGSVVYNTTNDALEQYDGTNWTSYVKKSTSDDISISVNGSNLVITVAGIGSTSLTLV